MLRGRFELNFEQIYLDAKADKIEGQLEDELASFADLLAQHYDFKLFLEDPRIAADYKKKCLIDLCPKNMTRNFFSVINGLIDNGREELINELAKTFTKQLAKDKKMVFGLVTSVCQLPVAVKKKLEQDIKNWKACPVVLRYRLDSELLGGLCIKFIDGMVLDISLKHKLNNLKEVILA
ncbi:ATP synthase F1 subunit delta [candidate division WOR-1 bacterium RIFOXYB2_FULL_42_35]|uniref:ATP synthase subunit delta n=1 Tax=candidate division WOR-1 bacterium RIFOXYC2_FULL_41_25 TaxID=1802586 RepID=A0A1F4TL94_UNCSA|nr:MAG: ATP synthase F1 subunit delta [candidate division WOR-1 bacterium RIFOXYA2_FULL_41_14]OGC22062.1 MAG: ATP synthase F1 subunit delta [candidate division WOR-1 bacterium RIFOXYB2_FULL_42_35]OGC32823.1 MAG: ATP synthase F1 subunit delta [candidate division WOR-1 bacterium RIFOXYC2_FULL_41_25]